MTIKTIEYKSFFKTVTAKQAEYNPALADRIGKRRPDITWLAPKYESLSELAGLEKEVVFFINKAIESYGRELIAKDENAANWNYVPTLDELSLVNAYKAATTVTSKARALTKVTAAHFAKFYSQHAPALLGIPAASALAAEAVLCNWLTYAKQDKFRTAMHARLEQFASAIMAPGNEEVLETFASYEDCDLSATLEALLNAFSEVKVEAISADAL